MNVSSKPFGWIRLSWKLIITDQSAIWCWSNNNHASTPTKHRWTSWSDCYSVGQMLNHEVIKNRLAILSINNIFGNFSNTW